MSWNNQDKKPPFSAGGSPGVLRENVATQLRRRREQRGLDLRKVAQTLRIRHVYLEAIESGRYENLPGSTYAIGFLRTYAEYLGLDGEALIERFKEEVKGLDERTHLNFPSPVTEGKIPGGAIIFISLLLAAIAYGGWVYLSNEGKQVADLIPALPDRLQAMLGDEESSPVEESATMAAAGEAATAPASEAESEAPPAFAASSESGAVQTTAETRETEAQETPETVSAGASTGENTAGDVATSAPEVPATMMPGETALADGTAGAGGGGNGGDADTAPGRPNAGEVIVLTPPGSIAAASDSRAASSEAPGERPTERPTERIVLTPPRSSLTTDDSNASERVIILSPPNGDRVSSNETPAYEIPAAPSAPQIATFTDNREPRVYGENNQNVRIVLRATQDSWVQVRDSQDTLLLTRVLRTGDSYMVPNQDGLTLLTGNAGGIEITVDGSKLAPVGPVGAVRRNIMLDPQRLLDGTAVPR